METPTSSSKRIRPKKHAPTPKMLDRKKSLFTKARSPEQSPKSDDSDLGILSPIYLSSGDETSTDEELMSPVNDTRSSASHKKLQRYNRRFSDVNKYEMIQRPTSIIEETDEEDNELSTTEMSQKNLSECLSAPIVLLTPNDANTGHKGLKTSFKKTLPTIYSPRTPDQENVAPHTKVEEKETRARASLVFNDGGAIPTNLFYSSASNSNSTQMNKSVLAPSNSHPPSKVNYQQGVKFKSSARVTHGHRNHHTTKRKEINRGVFHKIRKTKPKKKMNKQQIYYAAMKIVRDNEQKTTAGGKDNQAKKEFERLRKILHSATSSDNQNNKHEPDVLLHENEIDNILNYIGKENTNQEVPNKVGKFFKSKSEKKAKYQVMQNLSVNIDKGKIQLNKPIQQQRPKKRKLRSLFDDDYDAEAEELHDEVVSLLKDLERDVFPATPSKSHSNAAPKHDSPTTHKITSLTSEIAEWNPVSDTRITLKSSEINCDAPTPVEPQTKLFPLFYPNHGAHSSPTPKEPSPKKMKRSTTEWRGFGENQLQIDAGQKEYGYIECKRCGVTYTQHVPEDEVLHNKECQNFTHHSSSALNFKGWEKENKVIDIPEWGVSGRIIAVSQADTKHKLNKVQEVLRHADLELGFAQIPLGFQSIVYLACNHNEILGVCVAQPQRDANKLISDFGIDFCSSEYYDVKCGISRIWVSQKHRRQGVGTKLINAVQGHFSYGYRLSMEEIAFSAPTEMGKLFAQKVTGKKDFYVYQS